MNKRIIAATAACALCGCLALFGCSSDDKSADTTQGGDSQTPQAEPATPQEEAPAATKYAVSIDDCQVTEDYSGKPAIVVTYTFTNNSDEAQSFLVAISAKCFQNGVQLDTGIVEDMDAQSSMNEIKPGATTTVQQAYLLDDQSEVSVECTELISFDDTILAEKTFSVA